MRLVGPFNLIRFVCLTSLALFGPFVSSAQQQIFTVDHNGTSSVFTHLDSAINGAQAGDVINLPGGLISFSGTIRKGVSLVGAGFFLDSTVATSQTIITNTVSLKNGASNLSASGIYFQANLSIDSCSNVLISRCRTASVNVTRSQNNIFSGSVISGVIDFDAGNASSLNNTIQNCIIYNNIYAVQLTVKNSIIFKPSVPGTNVYFLYSNIYSQSAAVSNSVFQNNIIYQGSSPMGGSSNYNYYYNNIFTNVNNGSNSLFVNNQANVSPGSLLLGGSTMNTLSFSTSDNFHLVNPGPGVGAGLGGTDCGIYGGTTPWKEGALPYNPHIQQATIPSITDQNGNLNVIFKVKAQDN